MPNDSTHPKYEALVELLTNYSTTYEANYTDPEAVGVLKKSFMSNNITIEDWNTIVDVIMGLELSVADTKLIVEAAVEAIQEVYDIMYAEFPTNAKTILKFSYYPSEEIAEGLLDDFQLFTVYNKGNNEHTLYIHYYGQADKIFDYNEVKADIASKVNKTNVANQLYGTDTNGQTTYAIGDEANNIPIRSTNGRLTVSTPVNDGDATNKKFVYDNFTTQSTHNSAVADLQSQINALSAMGRYCSLWNGTTGKPSDLPPNISTQDYEFHTGDFFIVSVNGNKKPNFPAGKIPHGTTLASWDFYTTGTEAKVGDVWRYDGTNWALLELTTRTVTMEQVVGLVDALTNKRDIYYGARPETPKAGDIVVYPSVDLENEVIIGNGLSLTTDSQTGIKTLSLNKKYYNHHIMIQWNHSSSSIISDINFNITSSYPNAMTTISKLYEYSSQIVNSAFWGEDQADDDWVHGVIERMSSNEIAVIYTIDEDAGGITDFARLPTTESDIARITDTVTEL